MWVSEDSQHIWNVNKTLIFYANVWVKNGGKQNSLDKIFLSSTFVHPAVLTPDLELQHFFLSTLRWKLVSVVAI